MSKSSGTSTGSSNARQRRSVAGVPKLCWCGASILANMSRSEANPYRRYYRCSFAASHRLADDTHIFKWCDEALLNEVETLAAMIGKLEKDMLEIRAEHQKMHDVFDKIREEHQKMHDELVESKRNLQQAMTIVVLGSMFMIGIMKLM